MTLGAAFATSYTALLSAYFFVCDSGIIRDNLVENMECRAQAVTRKGLNRDDCSDGTLDRRILGDPRTPPVQHVRLLRVRVPADIGDFRLMVALVAGGRLLPCKNGVYCQQLDLIIVSQFST